AADAQEQGGEQEGQASEPGRHARRQPLPWPRPREPHDGQDPADRADREDGHADGQPDHKAVVAQPPRGCRGFSGGDSVLGHATPSGGRTTKLTCRAACKGMVSGKTSMAARSGAAPGSAAPTYALTD